MVRKMKDSGIEWIGEIPEDWETIRVKNLFNVSRGRVISKLETTDEGKYPVYSSQTENDGIFGYIDTYDYSGEALTWTTDGEKAGTVFYRNGKYNCTNICGILQKKEDSIYKTDIKYLFYAIRMVAEENRRPDTNGHKIMSNEMEKLSIPITNYDEQVKIGLTLDEKSSNIDNTLNLVKKEIETLENYKKSLITEAVTKGLDKDVEMKDSGIEWIGQIPKHWIKSKVKHACSLIGSGTTPASHNLDFYSDDGINWIQSGDLYKTNEIITTEKNITEMAIKAYPILKIYESPYLVMAMYGASVGNLSISKIDAATNQACCVMKTNNRTNLFYLYYWLLFVKDDFLRKAEGGSQPNISQDKIKNQIMYFPPILEQDAIVNYLNKKTKLIDQTISIKQKQLQILEEYKKSLIYEYVTGKKEAHLG